MSAFNARSGRQFCICRSRKKLVQAKLPFNLFITGDAGFFLVHIQFSDTNRLPSALMLSQPLPSSGRCVRCAAPLPPPDVTWRGKCPSDYTTSREKVSGYGHHDVARQPLLASFRIYPTNTGSRRASRKALRSATVGC